MQRPLRTVLSRSLALGVLLLVGPAPAGAYSVLTHEAVIDTAWDDTIRPAILARFPKATDEQLLKAHAFAYGGVIVQDMGYYPFGTHFYSDLTHYVRSGEFIENILAGAQTLEEYAFALGSIAHYAGDTNGHSIATNPSVPLIYPKMRRKYGDVVTYADDETSHVRTEFGFDVLQAARGHYKSEAYHDFIGFEVSRELLERAFEQTYGLAFDEVVSNPDLAIGSFRFAVSTLVPNATEAAWELKKDEIVKESPGLVREKFVYSMNRESYEKEWGTSYVRPGTGSKLLAAFLRVVPKVGPFKAHGFEPPTPEAERLYLESFDRTVATYRGLVARARQGKLELDDRNFDTGQPVRIGEYVLADQAYEKWLRKLEESKFRKVTPEIRETIVAFYAEEPAAVASSGGAGAAAGPSPAMPKSQAKASRESIRDAMKILPKLVASAPESDALVSNSDAPRPLAGASESTRR